jgi:hypothetical protein
MKNIAHGIRVLGNWGAHPQDDGLNQVTREEVQAALVLIKMLASSPLLSDAPRCAESLLYVELLFPRRFVDARSGLRAYLVHLRMAIP